MPCISSWPSRSICLYPDGAAQTIERDPAVVKRILAHLGLWDIPERSHPTALSRHRNFYDPDFIPGL